MKAMYALALGAVLVLALPGCKSSCRKQEEAVEMAVEHPVEAVEEAMHYEMPAEEVAAHHEAVK